MSNINLSVIVIRNLSILGLCLEYNILNYVHVEHKKKYNCITLNWDHVLNMLTRHRCTNVSLMNCSTSKLHLFCNLLDKLLSDHCLRMFPKWMAVSPKSIIHCLNFLNFEKHLTLLLTFVIL